uniref:Cell surface protein n=1 Tax=uncultured prokaryote TaxID=198431 RepID=H5S974_9ZZZZ|nr:cell surface protein [uncultured prokaryote]
MHLFIAFRDPVNYSIEQRNGVATQIPHAHASADPTAGPAPLIVSFTGSGSDPDGESIIQYEWDFGDGSPKSNEQNPSHTYTVAGTFTATLKVTDADGSWDTDSVTITVTRSNQAPTANSQAVATNQDTPVTITLTGSDPDNDPLTFSISTPPAHGTLGAITQLNPTSAQVTYTPNTNFIGSDSFAFMVNDGTLDSSPATVSITVQDARPPALITNFQASDGEDRQSTLAWTNPSDSDLAEILVRRKLGSYPANHTDGDDVAPCHRMNPTAGGTENCVDAGLANGTVYYYAVFSRDQAGNWNDQVVEGQNADMGAPQTVIIIIGQPWPMFGHDSQHTGRSPFVGPQTNNVKWTFVPPAEGDHDQSIKLTMPVVAQDGTIYVQGAWSYGGGQRLYALNPDGTLKWKVGLRNDAFGLAIGIGDDSTLYLMDNDFDVIAVDPNGLIKWRVNLGRFVGYGLTLGPDNTIYIQGLDYDTGPFTNVVYALDKNGSVRWRYENRGHLSESPPAVASDGTIYITKWGPPGGVVALNPDGTVKWDYTLCYWCGAPWSPSVGSAGEVYILFYYENSYYLQALSPSGSELWSLKLSVINDGRLGDPKPAPAIAHDGTIIVPLEDHIFAVNPNGTLRWTFTLDAGHNSLFWPAIGADGTIYVGSNGSTVYALTSSGTLKWRYDEIGRNFTSPALGQDGTLYIIDMTWSSHRGTLFAIGP